MVPFVYVLAGWRRVGTVCSIWGWVLGRSQLMLRVCHIWGVTFGVGFGLFPGNVGSVPHGESLLGLVWGGFPMDVGGVPHLGGVSVWCGFGVVPIDVGSVPHLGGHFWCVFGIVPKECWWCAAWWGGHLLRSLSLFFNVPECLFMIVSGADFFLDVSVQWQNPA